MFNKKFLGWLAEIYICLYYVIRLYKPIAWRFKLHKFGEIDWIFLKKKELVFVEVKFRKSKVDLENIVHPKQVMRIMNMSRIFLMKNPLYHQYCLRFDLAVVSNFKVIRFVNIWNNL